MVIFWGCLMIECHGKVFNFFFGLLRSIQHQLISVNVAARVMLSVFLIIFTHLRVLVSFPRYRCNRIRLLIQSRPQALVSIKAQKR